jgi:hypothetical protein
MRQTEKTSHPTDASFDHPARGNSTKPLFAVGGLTIPSAQVVGGRFKDFSFDTSLRLLLDDMPGWQVMRHHSPRRTTKNHPTQVVEDLGKK